jgi:hypothetical protein
MQRRITSMIVVFALVFSAIPAMAAPRLPLAAGKGDGLSFPINVTSATQGTFAGTLNITRFAVDQGTLVAVGTVSGTLVDENGVLTSFFRTVSIPVIMPTANARAAVGCDILHLELGPLDLDLLGLVIHLDKIVLDIDAEPGAGNLLGNLLCAIVGLLDAGGPLAQLSQLLNRLLDILG